MHGAQIDLLQVDDVDAIAIAFERWIAARQIFESVSKQERRIDGCGNPLAAF